MTEIILSGYKKQGKTTPSLKIHTFNGTCQISIKSTDLGSVVNLNTIEARQASEALRKWIEA